MPGAVLLVDLHKTFDSLTRPFIFAMLKCHGFGNSLINWMRVLYKNPKCGVVNNCKQTVSKLFFDFKKGVRQGNPSFPLFLFYV